MILGDMLAYPLVGLVIGWLIIPFIMRLKVTSAYEILELRFGPAVRTLGSLLFLSLRLLWMSVIVYAMTSQGAGAAVGLGPPGPRLIVCALLALVTIVYTAMGGLRAVVITDVIQAAILFGAAIVTVITITVCLGGVQAWWPSHWPAHWPEPRFGYDPSARVPLFVIMLSTVHVVRLHLGLGPDRHPALSVHQGRQGGADRVVHFAGGRRAGVAHSGGGGPGAVGLFSGLSRTCSPTPKPCWPTATSCFPSSSSSGLPVGLSGLVVAGLLACAMSALSAGINSTCSVLTVDIIDRLRGTKRTADGADASDNSSTSPYLVGAVVVVPESLRQHGAGESVGDLLQGGQSA